MDDSILRIGVIGAGTNTKLKHIPGLQEIDGVEVVAVCNRSIESAQKVADEFGIPTVVSNWEDIIKDPEIDAVMIGTWPNMHAQLSIAALEAGKHVLTEARMAMNLEEAERMMAASMKYPHLVAQIVPAPFTLGVDATIARMIEQDELGVLYELFCEFSNGVFAHPLGAFNWRQDTSKSGINTLFSGIMHEAVLRWVDADPQWVIADGLIGTMARKDPETDKHEAVLIPESLTILARFPQGFKATYQFSGVAAGKQRCEVRISGSKGALLWNMADDKLMFCATGETEYNEVAVAEADRKEWRVEADFVDSIREGNRVELTSFETGVRYMQFSQAVWDSWTDGSKKVWL